VAFVPRSISVQGIDDADDYRYDFGDESEDENNDNFPAHSVPSHEENGIRSHIHSSDWPPDEGDEYNYF
jgi:hypothetical protein